MPWCRTTLFTKARATEVAVNGCHNAVKWAYLERRSTTTMITMHPFEGGNPSMKSMETSDRTCSGIDNGCSNPAGFILSYLHRWHISHSSIKFFTVFRKLAQENDRQRQKSVL